MHFCCHIRLCLAFLQCRYCSFLYCFQSQIIASLQNFSIASRDIVSHWYSPVPLSCCTASSATRCNANSKLDQAELHSIHSIRCAHSPWTPLWATPLSHPSDPHKCTLEFLAMKSAVRLLMFAKSSFIGISTSEVSHLCILLIFSLCAQAYHDTISTIFIQQLYYTRTFYQAFDSMYCAQAQLCTVKTVLLTSSILKQFPFPESLLRTWSPSCHFSRRWQLSFRCLVSNHEQETAPGWRSPEMPSSRKHTNDFAAFAAEAECQTKAAAADIVCWATSLCLAMLCIHRRI